MSRTSANQPFIAIQSIRYRLEANLEIEINKWQKLQNKKGTANVRIWVFRSREISSN